MAYRRLLRWLYVGLVVVGLVVGLVPQMITPTNPEAEASSRPEAPQLNVDFGPGTDEDGGPVRREGSDSECIIRVAPGVFHADDPYPQTAVEPDRGSWASDGYFDISHPSPQGRGEEVKVGETLVVYLYLENRSEGGSDCGIADANITVNDIIVEKSGDGPIGSMFDNVSWPDTNQPGLLTYQEDGRVAFGLFAFEIEPDDSEFEVYVRVEYTCDDPLCGLNDYDQQSYPSPDLLTIDGVRYEDYYGRPPVIRVVGPRAEVNVIEPVPGRIAAPYEVVDYIVELKSLDTGQDAITRITDLDEAPIPKCDESIFTDPDPDDLEAGWYGDEAGTPPKIDTSALTDPLDVDEALYCHFEVVMDPAIINNEVDNTFTLTGDLVAFNSIGQDVVVEVSAPPVLIADASVSVSKRVVSPDPLEGASVGDEIIYEIRITNDGDVALEDFTLIDSLIGRVPVPPSVTLAPDEFYTVTANYEVGLTDPTPLINTVTAQAHPVGENVPLGYVVSDSAAASITIISNEIKVELVLTEVDGVAYNPDTNQPPPKAGSVLTYQVEYCNQSADTFRDLRYVLGYPELVDGTAPEYVDTVLGELPFDPGCYQTAGTEFTFTVPAIDDPDFVDPVINSIRVRAISPLGQVRYAEHTLETNIVSDNVEIIAYRYSIETGAPLGSDTAALRGEDVYYHVELDNKSNRELCNVEIRHYVRNSLGDIVPGDPFVIPDSYIIWESGVNGRLEPDGTLGEGAMSVDDGNLRIMFRITGDTPDPLYRVFEVYADQDCSGSSIDPAFIDRAAVVTDISDVQVNATITVFAEGDDPPVGLDFGYRQPGLKYRFNYTATNVGVTFRIQSLQYCVLNAGGSCQQLNFPQDGFDFFGPGDDTYLPFETRSDQSDTLISPDGLTGDEPTPLQILVTLQGIENGKNVTVRTLYSFPLLTDELPGTITSGPSELVRGDGPAPYSYVFTNQTEGSLRDVRVLNLLETGPFSEGQYEPAGVPGFPANVNYEVCQVLPDQLPNNGQVAGVCNLTYHDGIAGGQFQMLVLVVGTRVATGDKVIGLGVWDVQEIPHLLVEKTGPSLVSVDADISWTISITNNSAYQPVDFSIDGGFTDVVNPTPPAGSFTPPSIVSFADANEMEDIGGGLYRLDRGGSATATADLISPPGGFGVSGFTNTATFVGTTAPNPDAPGESVAGRQVSGTAEASVTLACPLFLYGTFLPHDDPYAGNDLLRTVGESYRLFLSYWNEGTSPVTVSLLVDERFEIENGRSLTFNDIAWPHPEQQGLLEPGEFASYETDLIIRPSDFPDPVETDILDWDAEIHLADGPEGCDVFSVLWYFEIVNPVEIVKGIEETSPLIFPGDEITYQIALQNRSEGAEMFLTSLDDSVLPTDPLDIEFLGSGAVAPTGRLGLYTAGDASMARLEDDGVQNTYTVQPDDPEQLVNIATIDFYVPSDSGPDMEKGPNAPMSNVDSAEVATVNPLQLLLVPSTFEAPAGARIDIDVQVTNQSNQYTIDNIEITTNDQELSSGLAAANYSPPLLLNPSESMAFTVTDPYYVIPPDFTGDSWEICAQASGRLASLGLVLPQVETCVDISILPPDLTIEKLVFRDMNCTTELPDDDLNELGEATIGNNVYYQITVENASPTQIFTNLTFTDTTNDGGDLSQDVQDEFELIHGSTTMNPGDRVSVCIPYLVTTAALQNPVLTNTVQLDAVSNDIPFAIADEVSVDVIDANISIGKRTDRNVAFPGTTIEYTLVIINRNTEGRTLVLGDVWDTLISGELPGPPSYHDSCVAGGREFPDFSDCDPTITSIRFDDARWSWPTENPGIIPSGDQATFAYSYEVQPNDPDPLVNRAGVSAYLYDPSVSPWDPILEEGSGQPIRPIDQTLAGVAITESQLLVRKVATPSSALVGSRVSYQISITNVGDVPVSTLEVLDCNIYTPCNPEAEPFTPEFGGFDLRDAIVPQAYQSTLAPFETAVINTYELQMPTAAELLADPSLDPFINTAYAQAQVSIGGGQLAPTAPGTDTAIVDLVVPGISVNKSASVGAAGIGETVEYTIQVANTGEVPIRLDTVTDIVPGDSSWTPLTTMGLGSCEPGAPDYTVGSDLLPAGEFVCAVVNIVVGQPLPGSSEFVNTVRVEATVDPAGAAAPLVDSASAEIDIRDLQVTVRKEAVCIVDGQDCQTPTVITQVEDGTEYQYRLTIRNGSTKALSELRIIDPAMGDPEDPSDDDVPVIITDFGDLGPLFDPGEEFIYTYNHTASIEFDLDPDSVGNAYTNRATVVGVEDGTGELTPQRSANYTIIIKPLDIVVGKVACVGDADVEPDFDTCVSETAYAQPGDYIWYQVKVSNPAAVEVHNVEVDDTLEGVLDNGGAIWDGGAPGTLPSCDGPLWNPPDNCPTATFVYRGTDPVSAGVSSVINTVSASAISGSAQVSASDSATVLVASGDLLVTITEDSGVTQALAGDQLNFTINVQNLGADQIQGIDVLLPFISGMSPLESAFDLDGGGSRLLTASYTVTNADNEMNFEVVADGMILGAVPISDTDTWTVVRVTPGVSVTKTADRSFANVGDDVTYTVTVENTSTVGASIIGLEVNDPFLQFDPPWPDVIAAGESETRQYTHTITGNEGNPIVNEVTVSGSIVSSEFVVSDSWEVYVPDGDLLVTSQPSTTTAVVGDTVSFTYEICNLSMGTSPENDLTAVALDDTMGAVSLPGTTLIPSSCFTAVRDVMVTDQDIPQLSWSVTGRGTSLTEELTQTVTQTITVVPVEAGDIRLEVNPSASTVSVGDFLDVDFVISNVGDADLTITDFEDSVPWWTSFTPDPVGITLDAGQSMLFNGVALAAGGTGPIPVAADTLDPIEGTWTVTAEDASSQTYSHAGSIQVPIITEGASLAFISYDVDIEPIAAGQTVTYTYTVENLTAAAVTARLELISSTCTHANGTEQIWQSGGEVIDGFGSTTATATCEVPLDYTGSTIDHSLQVLDLAQLPDPQDTIAIQTEVEQALGVEVLVPDPDVWRVNETATVRYRVFNLSGTTTLTNVSSAVLNPTPCVDFEYVDANGTSVQFSGTLAPQAEVFAQCDYDVQNQDYGTDGILTIAASAEADQVIQPVEDQREVQIIDLGMTVTLSAVPAEQGGDETIVDVGETVSFTLTFTNTGRSPLELPPKADQPVSLRLVDAQTPTQTIRQAVDPNDLYDYLESLCPDQFASNAWPMEEDESCTLAFNTAGVQSPDLSVTSQVSDPTDMLGAANMTLWGAGTEFPVNQQDTWRVRIRRPSLSITNIGITPNPAILGEENISFTVSALNDGLATVRISRAEILLFDETPTAYNPQGEVVLTGTSRQAQSFSMLELNVEPTVVEPGQPTSATATWTPDRIGVFRAQVNFYDEAGAVIATGDANFTVTTEDGADGTDPDGNPLDPNALDPALTKTVEPESAFPNQQMTFTITITNRSTSTMENVQMVDAVPDAFPVTSASTTQGASIVSGQLVTVTTGTLGPGDRVTVTINVTVAPTVEVPSLWVNEVCANVVGRDAVCESAEVGVGAFGTGEGMLPTTGFDEPVSQGIPGTVGILSLAFMGGLMMLSTSQSNRQRVIILGVAGAAILFIIVILLLVILNDDEEKESADTSTQSEETQAVLATASPTPTGALSLTPTLVRRPTSTPQPTLNQTEEVMLSTMLPNPPTLRPSPTPYLLPTAAGPRRLHIPRLDFTRPIPIVELPLVDNSWDVSTLGHNIGWLDKTTWLESDWGNTVLVGHVQLNREDPGPFYRLRELEIGDEIMILEGDIEYLYEVTETFSVPATDITVTHPTTDPVLTLLTCTNWDEDNGVFSDRYIVRAEPVTG